MIRGDEIGDFVKLLELREVSLYHACQLVDFQSYLKLGGVPSRALLESERTSYTAFETDETDRINEVWDKVFVNLTDFGATFAKGVNNVPNPYGPILFQLRPSALNEASDVAVCLWSAGAKGFDRNREALKSVQDIDRLFLHSSQVPYPERSYIRFRGELKKEFGKEKAQDPEISCSVPTGMFSLEYVSVAWVDPYIIQGNSLQDLVDEIKVNQGVTFPLWTRRSSEARKRLYSEIAEVVADQTPTLLKIVESSSASQLLRDWARQVMNGNLEWQFKRFADYLREGTLLAISDDIS